MMSGVLRLKKGEGGMLCGNHGAFFLAGEGGRVHLFFPKQKEIFCPSPTQCFEGLHPPSPPSCFFCCCVVSFQNSWTFYIFLYLPSPFSCKTNLRSVQQLLKCSVGN